MAKIKSTKQILWTIFFTIFLDVFGVGIIIPVFPLLVVPGSIFKITPDTWNATQGFVLAGWLMASYPLAQFLVTPILGQIADKYGRRLVLIISIFGTILSYILFAIAIHQKNIPLLFIARILDGISGGNISAAQAVIGDISNAKNRAKNFGLVGVSIGIGFILGPFIGGRLSDSSFVSWFDVTTPFWFAAILSFINLISVIVFLPETLKEKNNNSIDITRPLQNIIKIFVHKHLSVPIISNFFFNAGFSFYTTFWGVILAYQFGYTQGRIGDFYAYVGIMIILAQGLVVRRLSGKVFDYRVLDFSFILAGVSILSFYFVSSTHVIWIYYLSPFLALFVALSRAFNMSLLSRVSTNNTRGEVMGINSSATALAQAIPAIMAGYIATTHVMYIVLVGGITTILGGIYFRLLYKNRDDT
jgi:DHA1 family tetracycline resistance protein-like MFS transporter